jgi:cytochrome P450
MAIAPGYTQWIPLPYGSFGAILRDPLGFQLRARERFGDIVRFRNGPFLVHFLYHPDQVRQVLVERQKNYLRSWQYRLMQRLFGDSLVVSEGEFWARERRLAQPAFHRERLSNYAAIMVEATNRSLNRWQTSADSGQPLNIGIELSRLALAIAGQTLFSRDVSQEADAVGSSFGVVGRYLERRFNNVLSTPPLWVPTPANARFKNARRTLNEIVLELVREHRREGIDRGDLLSMLIQVRDEDTGEQMTDDQVRSEALTFSSISNWSE